MDDFVFLFYHSSAFASNDFHWTFLQVGQTVASLDSFAAQTTGHIYLAACSVDVLLGHVQVKLFVASKALSLLGSNHFVGKYVIAELHHYLATMGTRNWSCRFFKAFDTGSTVRVSAWNSYLCVQDGLRATKRRSKVPIIKRQLKLKTGPPFCAYAF